MTVRHSHTSSRSLRVVLGAFAVLLVCLLLTATALAGPSPPTVTLVSPACGTTAGGTVVTITGSGFTSGPTPPTVMFGNVAGVNPVVVNATTITVTSPAFVANAVDSTTSVDGAGTVDVIVTDSSGTSAPSSADRFTYAPGGQCAVQSVVPACGSPLGGTRVIVTGPGVGPGDGVDFGTVPAAAVGYHAPVPEDPGVSAEIPGYLLAVSPPGVGTVPVTVIDSAGASIAGSTDMFTYAGDSSAFGLCAGSTSFMDTSGANFTVAAGHPDSVTASFSFATAPGADGLESPVHNVKDIVAQLPAGFLASLNAVAAQCPEQVFDGGGGTVCPDTSQLGWLTFADSANAREIAPVYLIARPPGHLAEVGVQPLAPQIPKGIRVFLDLNSSYQLTATIPNLTSAAPVLGGALTVFGSTPGGGAPFLYFPPSCAQEGSLSSSFLADDWDDPAAQVTATASSPGPSADCALALAPSLTVTPSTTQADSAAGYDLHIALAENTSGPQWNTPAQTLKLTLPLGVSLNPAVADSLGACTSAQFGLTSSATPSNCPLDSAVGTITATTPVLPGTLSGGVYIAQDGTAATTPANPFHVFVEAQGSGLDVKLEGTLVPDPTTGQLVATLTGLPPVPIGDVDLRFNSGALAALANPLTCGPATTALTITPWSYPATAVTASSSTFNVDADGNGGACPSAWPSQPSFVAGPTSPVAGAFSGLTLTATRNDREAPLTAISLTTPPGFTALVGSVPLCDDADANAGTCPSNTAIGTATVGAGVGDDSGVGSPSSHQLYLSGTVYFTGPTDGDPFGVAIVVQPIVGPFNLSDPFGTPVVVRAGVAVNPQTAQITISAALPSMVDGVLLHARTVSVGINRPGFALNPTNCSPLTVTGVIAGAPVSAPFQVGGCGALAFHPKLSVSTSGHPTHADGAGVDVKVAMPAGGANLQSFAVTLPTQLPARLSTVEQACPAATFHANPSACGAGSIVGTATAVTPILPGALTGTVYLVSNGGAALPQVYIVLAADGVTVSVAGTVSFTSTGATMATVPDVPDVPITSLDLDLPTGPHSILTSTVTDLCGQTLTIPTKIVAQNGLTILQNTPVAVTGCTSSQPPASSLRSYAASLHGTSVALRVDLVGSGVLKVSGVDVKTYSHRLGAGIHRLQIALSARGRGARRHHDSATIKLTFAGASRTIRLRL